MLILAMVDGSSYGREVGTCVPSSGGGKRSDMQNVTCRLSCGRVMSVGIHRRRWE